jgi:circadian clock protein KaiC
MQPINGESALQKALTGIHGLDEITEGGFPRGRPTLVCGSAGAGKTLLAMEFLVRGATEFGEPGVFVSFEERAEDLVANVRSLGFDLDELVEAKQLLIDYVHVEPSEIEETGEYDLEGLFIRLGFAIDSIGAKRVVLDTLEALFGGLDNQGVLRAELRRLFRWLKDRGITAVITAERGDGTLTRHGIEEYVSDCVVLLDHRVIDQISTRRMRIVKYRGTTHGTNEYPFLIDRDGFEVAPITSLRLRHPAPTERISTGVAGLDKMLGGEGFFRGSSVLISGTAGCGKTSLSASFVDASCRAGERAAYFAFEESPAQLIRNMRSIGVDLEPWCEAGLLHLHAERPTFEGLEMHLARIYRLVREVQPTVVVIDPITNLVSAGTLNEVNATIMRLVDFLKSHQITAVMTSLTSAGDATLEQSNVGISSLIDTWLLLRDIEHNGERSRGIYVLKSRGMNHSHQIREFVFTSDGIELLQPYIGPEGVLTGTARLAQEAREAAAEQGRRQEIERMQIQLERRRQLLENQIATLRLQHDAEEQALITLIGEAEDRDRQLAADRYALAAIRGASNGS